MCEYTYEFGKYYGTPCLYLVYDTGTKVPYAYDVKPKKYWVWIPELRVYRRNVSML